MNTTIGLHVPGHEILVHNNLSCQTLATTVWLVDLASCPSVFPLFWKPHTICQTNTPTATVSNNIIIENTKNARRIAVSEEASMRLNPSLSSGTASKTCIDDKTKERERRIRRPSARLHVLQTSLLTSKRFHKTILSAQKTGETNKLPSSSERGEADRSGIAGLHPHPLCVGNGQLIWTIQANGTELEKDEHRAQGQSPHDGAQAVRTSA